MSNLAPGAKANVFGSSTGPIASSGEPHLDSAHHHEKHENMNTQERSA